MRKNIVLIVAAAALALLAGCSREDVEPAVVQDTDAISFSAYTGTAVTKGVAVGNSEIQGTQGGDEGAGIGVFAFYQPAVAGVSVNFNTRKFATPDFMYNQQVTPVTAGDADSWTYTPTKYWPNNEGDQLSFFAYAPYEEGTTWDDLGIATDATASKITASFPIYNEKAAMEDILWTDPQLNKTKASTAAGATDNPIVFNFRHILSKVAIQVGVESDQAAGQAGAWDYEGTDITINSIEFKGLAESYNFSCPITGGAMGTGVWTTTGSQDIKLTEDDFQNYVIQATDRATSPANVWNTDYWKSVTSPTYYKTLLAQENSKDAFLFFAPQTFTSGADDLVITYTVLTKENWNSSTLGANDSKIVNTIECSLADILPNDSFETGKAYTLKFLLGMNSVKVSANVGIWDELAENQIDVPTNEATIQANTLAQAQEAVTNEDGTASTLTVIVTEDAVNTATDDNVETVGDKNYLRFTLKTSSPENVNFELPSAPASVGDATITGWLVTYESGYPTQNVTVDAPAGTKVKIEAPTSHVEVTGTSYAEISAKTGDNTLVIPAGTTVDSLIINKGGLEIHGTVTAAQVSVSGTDSVFVRACEGLSSTVYDVLKGYIDTANCYVGEQESGKETYRIYKRIVAQIGDTRYSSLEKAFTVANEAGTATITMLADYQLAEGNDGVEVQKDKNITLDLNGKTVKNLVNADASSRVIHVLNGGTFTVNDNGTGGKITNELKSGVQCGHWNGRNWFTDVIQNEGTLVINGGTIKENYASASSTIAFAIDNNNNTGSAVTTINGGTVTNGRYAIRQFCQSATLSNSVTVHGGTITGTKAAIWTQLTSTDAAVNKKADVVIDGGTLSGDTHGMLVESDGNNFGNVNVTISGGTFSGDAPVTICGGHLKVTGGTFNSGLRVSHYGRNEDGVAASGVEYVRDYEVTGGTFNGSVYSFYNSTSTAETGDAAMKFLKGGTYSADPSTYVATGYTATQSGSTWTVEPAFVYDESDSKYHIYNLAGLKMFRDAVNGGNTYVDKTIVLDASIDLASVDNWVPIGLDGTPFNGTFDGQNHTISNLNINRNNHAGLFGYCFNHGYIENVTVDKAIITTNHYAGAVLAKGYADIINCHVKNSSITCAPEEVSTDKWDNGDKAGALAGLIQEGSYKVQNCSATNCTVKGYRDVGGLIGYKYSDNIVTGNTVTGTVGTCTVTVDNTHNYENYKTNADFDANAIVGQINGELDSSNTSTNVTISYPF